MTEFGEATVTRVVSEDGGLVQWCVSIGEAYAPDSSLCTRLRRSPPVDDGGDGLIADVRGRFDGDAGVLAVALVLTSGDVDTSVDCGGEVDSLDVADDTAEGTVFVRFHLLSEPECGREARIVATQGDRTQEVIGSA